MGRDNFLQIYSNKFYEAFEFFKNPQTDSSNILKSCIIIRGETRQGKSRLTEEIFYKSFESKIRCVQVSSHVSQVRVRAF